VLPSDYLGVIVLLFIGILTGAGALVASRLFGASRYQPNKESAYECGIPSEGAENQRFSVKFYMVAVSFILFDIEAIFLVPWALRFREAVGTPEAVGLFWVGSIFLFIVTLGLIYEWRKGLLDWNN